MDFYRYKEEDDSGVLEKAVQEEGTITGWETDTTFPVSSAEETEKEVEDLKEWQEEQQTAHLDGVVKGIKELEDFLSGTSDGDTFAALISNLTTQLSNAITTKYTKPVIGIPKSDLASAVQQSLEKADSALQEHQSLDEYATKEWVDDQGYLTEHQDISELKSDISNNADGIAENKELVSSLTQIMLLALTYGYDTPTESANPEFALVVTDLDGRILLAKCTDGKYLIMGKQYEL